MPDFEELEPHLKITLSCVLGTLADYTTTQIALKNYPELYEANPHPNFFNEFFFAETGGIGLYSIAKMLKQPTNVSLAFGLSASAIPWMISINNLAQIAYAHRKVYPWKECPLLYPE